MNVRSSRQRGASNIKSIAIIVGIGIMLIFIVFVATSAPGSDSNADGQSSGDQAAVQDGQANTRAIKLPEGFKRFTNKQYNLSVAFPEAWGGLATQAQLENSTLRATTKSVTYPIGNSQMAGTFGVSTYPTASFRVASRLNGQILSPSQTDNKTSWKVVTAIPSEPQYAAGNTFPVKSSTNPSGVIIHDFSRVLENGSKQNNWAFEAKGTFIFMSLPPIGGSNGSGPSGADLTFYDAFTKSVTDTITVPGA